MPVKSQPAIAFTLTIPDASTMVANDNTDFGVDAEAVPPNCRTIVIYNLDATRRVFIKFAPNTAITTGMMTISNSTVLAAGSSMTFAVGYLGDRPHLSMSQSEAFFLKAEAGTNVPVNITYLMGRGTQLL